MAIKIVCNGKVSETKIIDVASGVELQDNCTRAIITLDAAVDRAQVVLHFTDVALEVTGEVVETFPPVGLRLADVMTE
jgi:hypothetical protein